MNSEFANCYIRLHNFPHICIVWVVKASISRVNVLIYSSIVHERYFTAVDTMTCPACEWSGVPRIIDNRWWRRHCKRQNEKCSRSRMIGCSVPPSCYPRCHCCTLVLPDRAPLARFPWLGIASWFDPTLICAMFICDYKSSCNESTLFTQVRLQQTQMYSHREDSMFKESFWRFAISKLLNSQHFRGRHVLRVRSFAVQVSFILNMVQRMQYYV